MRAYVYLYIYLLRHICCVFFLLFPFSSRRLSRVDHRMSEKSQGRLAFFSDPNIDTFMLEANRLSAFFFLAPILSLMCIVLFLIIFQF